MSATLQLDKSPKCGACGHKIKRIQYQSRAADEAHTTIWSCDNCPLNSRRISVVPLLRSSSSSFPRVYHRRTVSARDTSIHKRTGECVVLELTLPSMDHAPRGGTRVENIRSPVPVRSADHPIPLRGYIRHNGIRSDDIAVLRHAERLTPHVQLLVSDTYERLPSDASPPRERDGFIRPVTAESPRACFVHSRMAERGYTHTLITRVESSRAVDVHSALTLLHSLMRGRVTMRWMVSAASSSHIHNLSPRAWDVLGVDNGTHIYTEKVDGERCYVLIYGTCSYMFRKGGGYPMVGWRVLDSNSSLRKPIILDVENTVSHGLFLIDMLTDSNGNPSPPDRTMKWVLEAFSDVVCMLSPLRVRVRKYYPTQRDADRASCSAQYPTDGVVAVPLTGTSAKKIKKEKAVELRLTESMSLVTSDGDAVVRSYPYMQGVDVGDIVELKFRLMRSGKSISTREAFRRTDKVEANSTGAVFNIMRSFRGVTRDDEARRRSVLMWCDSLRQRLVDDAICTSSPKTVVLDIGTGTGQSLDTLTPDKGVSYLLVEPDESRAAMLRRRTGGSKVLKEPREILAHMKHLKSGSETYVVANMTADTMLEDEDVAKLLSQEVRVATAVFSAQYAIASLYDIVNFWSIPLVGCIYPYDGVNVGECLVDALGVRMRRVSVDTCTVVWGGDKEYEEPYTTTSEYKAFSSVFRASDVLDLPEVEADDAARSICEKICVIKS